MRLLMHSSRAIPLAFVLASCLLAGPSLAVPIQMEMTGRIDSVGAPGSVEVGDLIHVSVRLETDEGVLDGPDMYGPGVGNLAWFSGATSIVWNVEGLSFRESAAIQVFLADDQDLRCCGDVGGGSWPGPVDGITGPGLLTNAVPFEGKNVELEDAHFRLIDEDADIFSELAFPLTPVPISEFEVAEFQFDMISLDGPTSLGGGWVRGAS